jgi:hypothetical protein
MLQAGGFTSLLSQIQALVPQFMQGAAEEPTTLRQAQAEAT